MTLDQRSRKMLERVGDVGQLRQGAMHVLARMHWRYSDAGGESEALPNSVTSDLWDIFEAAKKEADERRQEVSISGLIGAFPRSSSGDQLAYGPETDLDAVPKVIDRMEKGLVPRLADFMTAFEFQLRERPQQQLDKLLDEFGIELRSRLDSVAAAASVRVASVPVAAPAATNERDSDVTPHFLGGLFSRRHS